MIRLKNFFGDVFGFTEEITTLKTCVTRLESEAKTSALELKAEEGKLYSCQKDVKELKGLILPVDIPTANITYRRPILIEKDKWIQKEIDVCSFIMPDFTMKAELKKMNLIYDGSQKLNELIPAVYHLAKKNYKYDTDDQFGFSEFWLFPYESRAVLESGKGIDCDDWSILIASYFAAANIPTTNWLISAGIARAGYGHATIYAKDNFGVWRHLNSTRPQYKHTDLTDYPSNKDEEDIAGIKSDSFWFSFTHLFSLHKFESKEASSTFKKEKLPIKIGRGDAGAKYDKG